MRHLLMRRLRRILFSLLFFTLFYLLCGSVIYFQVRESIERENTQRSSYAIHQIDRIFSDVRNVAIKVQNYAFNGCESWDLAQLRATIMGIPYVRNINFAQGSRLSVH